MQRTRPGTSNPKPLQIQNHTRMGKFASVPLIPKFARECAARTCELRNRDTSRSQPLRARRVLAHGRLQGGPPQRRWGFDRGRAEHRLTPLKRELDGIETRRDDVGPGRHQRGDAADLRIGIRIRPRRLTCVTDGVVAAEPFVWAEGLEFHGSEGGLIDVCTWNVPARRESGLVEDERPRGIGYDAVTLADHEVTGGLANVDAMVVVSGMAHD